MIHDVIGRRKIVFDQFAGGFEILGFREAMKSHIDLFRELFVSTDNIDCNKIIACLDYSAIKNSEQTIKEFLINYLQKSGAIDLKLFLQFVTGSPVLPCFGLGKITVKVQPSESIFASVCTNTLTIPNNFTDQSLFNAAFVAVVNDSKQFNCV